MSQLARSHRMTPTDVSRAETGLFACLDSRIAVHKDMPLSVSTDGPCASGAEIMASIVAAVSESSSNWALRMVLIRWHAAREVAELAALRDAIWKTSSHLDGRRGRLAASPQARLRGVSIRLRTWRKACDRELPCQRDHGPGRNFRIIVLYTWQHFVHKAFEERQGACMLFQ